MVHNKKATLRGGECPGLFEGGVNQKEDQKNKREALGQKKVGNGVRGKARDRGVTFKKREKSVCAPEVLTKNARNTTFLRQEEEKDLGNNITK